jgi:hypothetical protein
VSFNVLNRRVHYWASSIIAIPLLIMIVTGVLLQVKKQWHWVQPPEQRGTGAAPAIGLAELLESVKRVPDMHVSSWDDVNRIDVRPDRGLAKVWLMNGYEVQVDLGTGAVLQTAYRRSDLIETIHDGSFFVGDWTKLGLFLPTGLTVLLLWLGGMWMWWVPLGARRRVRRQRAAKAGGVVVLVALTAAACRPAPATEPPEPSPPAAGQSEPAIAPLVGHWDVSSEDGAAVITADATRWDGQPRPDAIAAFARLFGAAPPSSFEANVTAPGAFPIAIETSLAGFTSGTLAVDFKLIGGESDQIAGLVFDMRPSGEYLYVRYNTRDDNVALWRFADGERARIADGTDHRRLPLEAWHTLTMTLDGTALSAVAAGDLRLTHTLEHRVEGRVGYWTKRDSITAFRHLRVQ